MAQNYVDIPLLVIGYNEKGLIGFIRGGKFLSYVDDVPVGYTSVEQFAKEKELPFISTDDVCAVNDKKWEEVRK